MVSLKNILIYRDEGAHPRCIRSLVKALHQEEIPNPILFADRHTFKDAKWQESASLLIFPGGRDIPYHEALKGQPNRQIRQFVEQGGSYFGICAGAYYGSAQFEFEKGQPLEVIGKRELCFFPGKALGPAYGLGQFCYETEAGARIARLHLASQVSAAYYNGGCTFDAAQEIPQVTTIARFYDLPDQPAAIIECSVGKGRAILSGVHPEYSSESFQSRDPLVPALQQIEAQRRSLFKGLLQRLLEIA